MFTQKRIMLLVTENCNLRCSYCYEHQKNSKKMTFKMAKNILDETLKGLSNNELNYHRGIWWRSFC